MLVAARVDIDEYAKELSRYIYLNCNSERILRSLSKQKQRFRLYGATVVFNLSRMKTTMGFSTEDTDGH
jgi:hypothetical protein